MHSRVTVIHKRDCLKCLTGLSIDQPRPSLDMTQATANQRLPLKALRSPVVTFFNYYMDISRLLTIQFGVGAECISIISIIRSIWHSCAHTCTHVNKRKNKERIKNMHTDMICCISLRNELELD